MSAGSATHTGNADPAELGRFDAQAHRFWDPQGEFAPLHLINPVRAGFILERAAIAGACVLDVGCGGGLLAERLARAGARVTAIDLAPAMIRIAQLHAAEQGLHIDYRHAGVDSLQASHRAAFDVVTCMEMLEHVPEPAAMVSSLARLVRPGGQLFISTLNRNVRSFFLAIVAAEHVLGLLPRGTHEYERLIRPSELARWARVAGLTLREIAGIRFDPLTRQCALTRDPAVKYLAHFEAGAPAEPARHE